MKVFSVFLVGAYCVAAMLCAKQVGGQVIELKTTTKVEVALGRPGGMIGRAICDGAGNVYTRELDQQSSTSKTVFQLPIQKITPTGVLAGTFRVIDAFPEDTNSLGKGGFVDHDGRVYQRAMREDGIYVAGFARDGTVNVKTKLDAERNLVEPWHLAVFKSGEYLLTGTTGKNNRTPFAAVFAANGQIVKKIYEPEDEEARRKAEMGDARYASSNTGNSFVSSGDVAIGSDGNAYLLHGTSSPALVYVISPTGEVVRKLRVDTANPDLTPRSVKSYAGRLAIGFGGWVNTDPHQNLIKVTDLQGNPLADYVVSAIGDESLFMAGYGPEGFTFVPDLTKDKLYLVKAKLP